MSYGVGRNFTNNLIDSLLEQRENIAKMLHRIDRDDMMKFFYESSYYERLWYDILNGDIVVPKIYHVKSNTVSYCGGRVNVTYIEKEMN